MADDASHSEPSAPNPGNPGPPRLTSHPVARGRPFSLPWLVQSSDLEQRLHAYRGLGRYFRVYCHQRQHQALCYQTQAQVYGVAA